jgi:hypothetical protein
MLETPFRHAATVLLESAIRIAPPDTRDWGQAMREELSYVEGPWAAVMWALGGASVIAKHALLSLFIPAHRGQANTPDGGLFAKTVSLRKVAFVAGGAYVLAALIFFAAPPFRQGLRVSLAAWNELLQVRAWNGQPRLRALSKRAEQRHDPEGLVFAAARLWDASESARLAQEAVRLDPNLLWVYAVVAVRHPELAEIHQWLPKLEGWDPQNALFDLITAESIDVDHINKASRLSPKEMQERLEEDPAWQRAMAAAFASPKFDDYLDRLKELDRRIVPRYGFSDPYEMLSGEDPGLPTYAFSDSRRFAKSLLQSGQNLEARGDRKGAVEKYWAVARFGQVMDSQAHSDDEHWTGTALQALAYKQLQVRSEKGGKPDEAALFSYLAAKFDPLKGERTLRKEWFFGSDISRRNAAVLQISSLMMLIFSGLMVVTASVLIAGGRRGKGPVMQRVRPGLALVALTSAVGLLVSSATLYLTYRPYWYIFQRAILSGDRSHTRDLRDFLMATQVLPALAPGSGRYLKLPVYFWTGVTLLGVIGLALILLRHFLARQRPHDIQHIPRLP